ncbi:MAG: hypothetical protein KBE86_03290, partial [Chitinophagales bacterium]|nr:hypothetical protein [Chitinophagales bacterium]
MRNVQYVFQADTIKLGKSDVLQALPIKSVEQVSPFLLLHHFKKLNIPAGEVDFAVSPHPQVSYLRPAHTSGHSSEPTRDVVLGAFVGRIGQELLR